MTRRKTALVTGASAGIGAATAKKLAHAGYDLALAYRSDRTGVEAVAAHVEGAGARVVVLQADLGDPKEVDSLFTALDAEMPQLDALVNNAGIVSPGGTSVAQMDAARIKAVFEVNVVGAFLVAGHAVRRMAASGGGSIVNVSSAAARLASAGQYVDYAATKAALDTLTKGLAEEVAGQGIRVNAVRPGIIETAIHAKGGQPDRVAELGPKVPMGRAGTSDEVADAIVWLLSDSASYVTGAFLDVSGGR